MGSGIGGHPGLAVYRLVKAGESGMNLSLTDLFGTDIEVPNLWEIIKTLFSKRSILVKVKPRPERMVAKLITVQRSIDEKVEKEISDAKRKTG